MWRPQGNCPVCPPPLNPARLCMGGNGGPTYCWRIYRSKAIYVSALFVDTESVLALRRRVYTVASFVRSCSSKRRTEVICCLCRLILVIVACECMWQIAVFFLTLQSLNISQMLPLKLFTDCRRGPKIQACQKKNELVKLGELQWHIQGGGVNPQKMT